MPSTFSPSLRIELIGAGEQSGTWNNTTNNNLGDLIEQAISGATTVNVTSADVTLTALNGITDEARSAVLIVTGTPGTTRSVIIPDVSKTYTVKNNSDSIVQIKTASGIAYSMVSGSEAYVYCNGSNVVTGRSISTNGNTLISATQPSSVAQSLGIAPTVSPALTGTPTAPTATFGTSTTQVATTAFVNTALQAVYPIGSVYINATSASSPATLFGFGTWAEIGAGRVLVGQNVGDASFDVLGETGGSKDATLVSHSHTGTTANTSINHTHTFSGSGTTNSAGTHNHSGSTDNANLVGDFWVGGANGGTSGIVSLIQNAGRPGLDNASGYQQLYRVNASHTHSLSINSAGEHEHTVSISGTTGATDPSHNHTFTTASAGSSATNANLQPYLVVKMWQRTA